jgi:hypothetical protein
MITVNNFLRKRFLLLLLLLSCTPELVDDPIPFQPFPDATIVLTNHVTLGTDGGSVAINNIGVRGVILYRKNSSTYLTFERNCSFQPNSAGATIEVHSSTLYMHDASCGSSFNFEGEPTGGPAWRRLRQYETFLSGNTVIITDTIVE